MSNMRESRTGLLRLDYEEDIVRNFLHFFYSRHIAAVDLSEDNLNSYLELANMFDPSDLKQEVEEKAAELLKYENMISLYFLAELHQVCTSLTSIHFLFKITFITICFYFKTIIEPKDV